MLARRWKTVVPIVVVAAAAAAVVAVCRPGTTPGAAPAVAAAEPADTATAVGEARTRDNAAEAARLELIAAVTVAEPQWNAGRVEPGQRLAVAFPFRNGSNVPLRIADCKASCGCAGLEYEKTSLPPGATTLVRAEVDAKTGQQAFQHRLDFAVATVGPDAKVVTTLAAFVVGRSEYPLQVVPKLVTVFAERQRAEPTRHHVNVYRTDGQPVTDLRVHCDLAWVKVASDAGGVEVVVDPALLPAGSHAGKVHLSVAGSVAVPIPVQVTVTESEAIRPGRLVLGMVGPGATVEKRLHLLRQDLAAAPVTMDGAITLRDATPSDDGDDHGVTVRLQVPEATGFHRAELHVGGRTVPVTALVMPAERMARRQAN